MTLANCTKYVETLYIYLLIYEVFFLKNIAMHSSISTIVLCSSIILFHKFRITRHLVYIIEGVRVLFTLKKVTKSTLKSIRTSLFIACSRGSLLTWILHNYKENQYALFVARTCERGLYVYFVFPLMLTRVSILPVYC